MKITLEQLYKNNRYRMFKLEDKYYLIDCDASIWFYIFPFLVYFWKHKCYEITQAEYEELVISRELQQKYLDQLKLTKGVTLSVSFLAPLILKYLKNVIKINAVIFFFVSLFILVLIGIFLRIFYTKSYHFGDRFSKRPKLFAYIQPSPKKRLWRKIYVYIFSVVLLIAWILVSIAVMSKDYFILFGVTFSGLLYLFLNIVFLGIDDYYVKQVR